jgi:hypothetical protein
VQKVFFFALGVVQRFCPKCTKEKGSSSKVANIYLNPLKSLKIFALRLTFEGTSQMLHHGYQRLY